MTRRVQTRTWSSDAVAADLTAPAVAQVQDPAVRAILRIVSRSLKAICAAIDQRCGTTDEDG